MFRPFALALAILSLASTALAFDIDNMSETEKDAFGKEVRAYLLANPEVFLEIVQILEDRSAAEAAAADLAMIESNADALFEDDASYVGGNPDGDVTIVEFLDYRCSFCRRAFPAVEELIATDGNIRIIVKEFPILGDASVQASRYAIATLQIAGSEAYKQVHDSLMTMRGEPNAATFRRISEDLLLDHDAIVERMPSAEVSEVIEANYALGQNLQIQGTPSFVMGDTLVRGFVELDQMRDLVEDIRAEAG